MPGPTPDFDWNPFIGRALGLLCLHQADMRSKGILEQADFLMGLGMHPKDAAVILGSSEASLREMARQKAKREKASAKK
jgi:hypothetical protein